MQSLTTITPEQHTLAYAEQGDLEGFLMIPFVTLDQAEVVNHALLALLLRRNYDDRASNVRLSH